MIRVALFITIIFAALFGCGTHSGKSSAPKPIKLRLSAEQWPRHSDYQFGQQLPAALTHQFDSLVHLIVTEKSIAAITISVLSPKGCYSAVSGFTDKTKMQAADSSTVFYWASAGKLVTSIVIHQLIAEGKLTLNDKLSNWYPDFQESGKITVEHLLTHRSGLYSFNNDSALHFSPAYKSPAELLEASKSKTNLFPPGKHWSYSNTGYLLLALIAEKIEHKTFAQLVNERLAIPLSLPSLKSLSPHEQPQNLALAHAADTISVFEYSTPLGAGNIFSTAVDMNKLLFALFTGKLFPQNQVAAMFSVAYPMFGTDKTGYGRGIMVYNFSAINQTPGYWIGHSGGTENYKAIVAYDLKTKSFAAVSVNQNFPAEAVAVKLFAMLGKD